MATETGAAATFEEGHGAEHIPNGAAPVRAARAYVTLLGRGRAGYGGLQEFDAVVRLANALREARAAYPLVVAVPPDVPEDLRRRLAHDGCVVREYPPKGNQRGQVAVGYYEGGDINYHSKLCCIFQFPEYERLVYVDAARIQMLEDMDDLFRLEKGYMYAWMDFFDEKAWTRAPQYKIAYRNDESSDMVARRAVDAELAGLVYNAAVLVHEPGMSFGQAILGKNLAVGMGAPYANAAGFTPREPGMPAEKLKMAYVTFLLPIDDIHLKSVLELNWGLRNVGTTHPLVVFVPSNLPEADRLTLLNEGCIVHEIEVALRPPINENNGHIGMVYGVVNSKLSICKLEEYERVVFLDARIKALRQENLDELFDLEKGYLYAWPDGFRRDKEWIRTPQHKIVYNGQEPQPQPDEMVAIAWARDDLVSVYFNAGVFVHEPAAMDFSKVLLDALGKPFTGKIILDPEGAEMGGPISASSAINLVAGGIAVGLGFFVLLLTARLRW